MLETYYASPAQSAQKLLKTVYGAAFIIAGADKFFNMLTLWSLYLNPTIAALLPIPAYQAMYGIGSVEILVGLLIVSKYTRFGALAGALALVVIALNLISLGQYFDVAVRDLLIATGLLALHILSPR
jgi:uncharacterized membrane protein YphA (DoxX/SURF4 family)